jgi:hypothetical protein
VKDTFTVPTGLRFEGRETYGKRTLLFFTELDATAPSYGTTFTVVEGDAERTSFSIVEKRAFIETQFRQEAA